MKFTISSFNLLKKLKLLNGMVKNNNVFPILDNFLFEINKNKLIITATDLENTIRTRLDIVSDINCKILVPAKFILSMVNTLKNQKIDFLIKKKIIEIRTQNGFYSFTMPNSDEFPPIPIILKHDEITISKDIFLLSVKSSPILYIKNIIRQLIKGVLIQFSNEGLKIVSTDTLVLTICICKDVIFKKKYEFILPNKSIKLLKNILENTKSINIKIEYDQENLLFNIGDEILISRFIEGKFPDYESILPYDKINNNLLIIHRITLLKSIERISIFANDITKLIYLKLSYNILEVYTDNPDLSHRAIEYIDCDYNGKEMKIGFHYLSLKNLLLNLSSEYVIFKIYDTNSAIILQPKNQLEDIIMIIMPIMTYKD
jgi:DNA polymerase III subunit beta